MAKRKKQFVPITDEGRRMMDRVVAARVFVNRVDRLSPEAQAELEFRAFMDIFHPKYDQRKVHEMAHEIRDNAKRRA